MQNFAIVNGAGNQDQMSDSPVWMYIMKMVYFTVTFLVLLGFESI